MDIIPSDILSLIICHAKPTVIERVCKRWKALSRARRYLGRFLVPAMILIRYPNLTTFEGRTDALTPEVLDLKCDLTVVQPKLDVEAFMNAYRPGKRLTVESSKDDHHMMSFDGKRLTIKLNMMVRRQPKHTLMWSNRQLKDGLADNLINMMSHFNVFEKKSIINQTMGNPELLNLTCLEKAKWGKIDLDIVCGARYMVILPEIEVGLLRFWRINNGSNSMSLMLGLMQNVKFDQAEAHTNTEILHDDITSCGEIKLVPTRDKHLMFYL